MPYFKYLDLLSKVRSQVRGARKLVAKESTPFPPNFWKNISFWLSVIWEKSKNQKNCWLHQWESPNSELSLTIATSPLSFPFSKRKTSQILSKAPHKDKLTLSKLIQYINSNSNTQFRKKNQKSLKFIYFDEKCTIDMLLIRI